MNRFPAISLVLAGVFFSGTAVRAQFSADTVSVFHCNFDEEWDVNFDHWPDHWVRKTGPEYPHYVEMELVEDETVGRCLQIDVDGAAAAVAGPPVDVMSRFSYTLEAKVKNERLENSRVVITLDFYDAAGKLRQSKRSEPVSTTKGWQLIHIVAVEPNSPAIERAVVGLEVLKASKGDLQGRVSLGDVRLTRLPRISVTTNNPFNVYTSSKDVAVQCVLSGIREQNPEIRFQLFDSQGVELDRGSVPLNGRRISEAKQNGPSREEGDAQAPASYEGATEWKPNIPGYGYYRVEIQMLSSVANTATHEISRKLDQERTVWLAVVPPLPMPAQGEFGWSLPSGDKPLTLEQLSRLLPQVGINWVKLPVWYEASNARRGDELIRFVELAGASNIEVVGVIDVPPSDSELAGRLPPDATIGEVLSPESVGAWSPALEPVMTRLALRIRWWQLGRDYDLTFVSDVDPSKRVRDLRNQLFRFGQDVRLGICWEWESDHQPQGNTAWDFQQFCFSTAAAQKKLSQMLSTKPSNGALRWAIIEPPRRAAAQGPEAVAETPLLFRQFALQLVAAKEHGADAIIVSNPFNDENGLMRASGMPAELLLPWRTTAAMLGGAKLLGSIQLPGRSENRIFVRPDGKVVMVVWNDKPTQEVIYLGKDLAQYDLLGIKTIPRWEKNEQVIQVGPEPVFVVGLHEAITRWRMAVAFENKQVPSVYSKAHANALEIRNFFPQGVGGSLSIVVPKEEYQERLTPADEKSESAELLPDRWSIDPPEGVFKLPRDGATSFPFEIRLKNGATFGKQPVQIHFSIDADEHYDFSVYREMEVGTGDVSLEVKSYMNAEGMLIVEQWMANRSKVVADFRCFLRASGRRPLKSQVYQLGDVVDKKIYRFPNGAELLNQEMLLEIEELNGERMFRYRFLVTDSLPEDAAEDQDPPPSELPRGRTAI